MFKLVATVTLILAGQPVGDPDVYVHNSRFPSFEVCEAFRVSDVHAKQLENFREALALDEEDKVETKCEPDSK